MKCHDQTSRASGTSSGKTAMAVTAATAASSASTWKIATTTRPARLRPTSSRAINANNTIDTGDPETGTLRNVKNSSNQVIRTGPR